MTETSCGQFCGKYEAEMVCIRYLGHICVCIDQRARCISQPLCLILTFISVQIEQPKLTLGYFSLCCCVQSKNTKPGGRHHNLHWPTYIRYPIFLMFHSQKINATVLVQEQVHFLSSPTMSGHKVIMLPSSVYNPETTINISHSRCISQMHSCLKI